jgi:hypothetical protein
VGVAEVDLRARVSRAQVLEALVEMLGVPASRIGEAYGHELALQVLPRSRGFLTAINLSWPHEEFGDWIPEAQLALRLAQRFDTDAVIANVGHSKQNPDPGAFIVIKPTGETFAANDRSSGIFDDEDEFILDESPGAVTPLGRIAL